MSLTIETLIIPNHIEVQESGVREIQLLIKDDEMDYILPLNASHREMLLEALEVLEEDL